MEPVSASRLQQGAPPCEPLKDLDLDLDPPGSETAQCVSSGGV